MSDVTATPMAALPKNNARGETTLELVASESARGEWGRLIGSSQDAGLYHRERWIRVLQHAYGFELSTALLRSGGEAIAGCVFARSHNPFSRRLVALPFSDYCKPLAPAEAAQAEFLQMLGSCEGESYEIRGISALPPWHTINCFINWELDLAQPPARLYQGMAANFRRNVIKAGRNAITIECGKTAADLTRFRTLHDASRRRQGLPAQPSRFFRELWEAYSPDDDIEIWIASHRGTDLVAVLLLCDGEVAHYKWSARAAGEILSAGHLLLWSMIEAHARIRSRLDLGRTDQRNQGLNRFKHESGAVSIPLPYSFLPRAPREISPEVATGFQRLLAPVWRRLPATACRVVGGSVYRYLS
jgi:hypothetical protein